MNSHKIIIEYYENRNDESQGRDTLALCSCRAIGDEVK